MLFYDYDKSFILTGGNLEWMLSMIKRVPGRNFMINPEILSNKKYSVRDRVEFAGLCSLRNYEDYINRGIIDLHRDLIPPWVPTQIIEENQLVTTNKNYIELISEN